MPGHGCHLTEIDPIGCADPYTVNCQATGRCWRTSALVGPLLSAERLTASPFLRSEKLAGVLRDRLRNGELGALTRRWSVRTSCRRSRSRATPMSRQSASRLGWRARCSARAWQASAARAVAVSRRASAYASLSVPTRDHALARPPSRFATLIARRRWQGWCRERPGGRAPWERRPP